MITCYCLVFTRNYIQSLTSHTPKMALKPSTSKAEARNFTEAVKEQKIENDNMLPENVS
jgi:hypothetical protein